MAGRRATALALAAASMLGMTHAAQVAYASYDVEYLGADGATWASATTAPPRFLTTSDTLRLRVTKTAAFPTTLGVTAPTLDPSLVTLDPQGTDGTTAAAAAGTFGFTLDTAGAIVAGTGSTAAAFAITISPTATWVGAFTVALGASAVTDSAGDTSAVPTATTAGAFTLGWAPAASLVGGGGASITGTPQGPSTVYLRVALGGGLVDGASRLFWASGALATSDVLLDAAGVTVTDALNNVYTLAQAGISVGTTAVGGFFPASSVLSGGGGWAQFPLVIASNRIGGVFTLSLADGAVRNGAAGASFRSAAAPGAVTGFQVTYANPMTVALDVGTCAGGAASTCTGGTFTSALGGAFVDGATATLVLKATNAGGAFGGTPAAVPARFTVTGATVGALAAGVVAVATTPAAGSGATFFFAITLSSPPVDTYTIAAAPGAVTDAPGGTPYNSAGASVAGLTLGWTPAFDVVHTGAEGVSVQGTTVLTPASSALLKVTFPTDASALAPAAASLACDAAKLTLRDKANGTVFGTLAGTFGLSLGASSAAVDAGTHRYALLPLAIAAPYGGAFAVSAADGACWTAGGAGRKSLARAAALTSVLVQPAVVAQLVSVGAGGAEEVVADSTVNGGAATRALGLRESVVLRIRKRGAAWRSPVTVNPSAGTQIRVVNGAAAASPPTLALGACDHTASPNACDLPLTVLGKTVAAYTIAVDAGGLADADGVTSAAAAAALSFALRWSPRFGLTSATYASAPVDKRDAAWAPSSAGLFLMVGLGDQDPTITSFAGAASAWSLDWSKVTVRDSAGGVVAAPGALGLDLPSGVVDTAVAKTAAGDALFFGSTGKFINVGASPAVDAYTLDFDEGAVFTTGNAQRSAKSAVALTTSPAAPGGLSGVRVGYPLAATLVRGDKTTSLSTTWLDRHDGDVLLKVTPASGAISNFGGCAALAASSTAFVFKFTPSGGAGVAQNVTVGVPGGAPTGCVDNAGSAFFRVVLSGAGAAANTGFWSLDVTSGAVTSGAGGRHRNYPQTGVITAASKIMRVGLSVGYTVRDAAGNDMSGTSRQLTPGAAYFLRVTRTADDGGVFTAANNPVIDASKITVTVGGVTTTSVVVGSAIRTPFDGSTYVEVPLTVAAATPAGAYTFSVEEGFLTYSGTDNTDGTPGARIKSGKWAGCLTQAVGVHVTADTVDANGNSLEGRVLDTSVAANRVLYVRLWRTTGAFASPALAAIGGANCVGTTGAANGACLTWTYQRNGSAEVGHITPTASLYRATDAFVDFRVTLAADIAAGTYVLDLGEGVVTSAGGARTGATPAAASFSVAYAMGAGAGASDVHDGVGGDLSATWLGPASTAFLRLRLNASAAAGPAVSITGASGSVGVDTSKIVFRGPGGAPVGTFGFTGVNAFSAGGAVVDVGLDLSGVAPGVYTVSLLAGALSDANGVTSQAQPGHVVNQASGAKGIRVGFGLALEFWKADAGAPVSRVRPGEWVSGSTAASYALKVSPDAPARSNNVRLSSNAGVDAASAFYVPYNLTAVGQSNAGLFGASGAVAPSWSTAIGAQTALRTADTAAFAWTGAQAFANGSTAGRDFYWYTFAPSSALPVGAQAGAIGAGTLCNADCSIRNHAVALDGEAFKVGFDLGASLAKLDAPTSAGAVGVFRPYAAGAAFVTPPVPFNSYTNLALSLAYASLAPGYATTPPTTAVFAGFPLSSTPVTATATGATTALTFTLPSLLADQRTSGVYDLTLPAGALDNAAGTAKNAELRLRLVVGMPAVVWDAGFTAPAALRSANQSVAVFVTAARSLLVQQYVGVAGDLAATNFSALYGAVFKNDNRTAIATTGGGTVVPGSVGGLVGGLTARPLNGTLEDGSPDRDSEGVTAPFYALYRLDVSGLSDGTDFYTFARRLNAAGTAGAKELLDKGTAPQLPEWVRPNLALIIDRTPPVGAPARFAGTAPYVGATGALTLPTTLFTDRVSPPGAIRITRVDADDMHGFALVPGPQGVAQLVAAGPVLGPPGDVVFTVTGADEAGNAATASLTVTLHAKPKPALTVADSRSVFTSGTLTTGAAQLAAVGPSAGDLVLTAIATFPEAVAGITAGDLAVTKPWGADPAVSAPVASANGRVWTFAVTIPGASAATARDGDVWRFAVAEDAGVTVARGLATAASEPVRVAIDSAPPAGPAAPALSSFTAVVGLPFFAPVPAGLFADSAGGKPGAANPYATRPDALDLTGGTPDVSVGLTFTPGRQGAAYVSGTAATAPFNGYVDFTLTARDAAGNVNPAGAPVKLRVLVASQAAAGYSPVGGAARPPTLTFDGATAAFRDGGAALPLSPAASWASVDALTSTARAVDAVYVYLSTLDADAGPTPSESVGGTAPDASLEVVAPMTRFGAALMDVEVLRPAPGAGAAPIPPADVTSYLRSLAYVNARAAPTGGARTVHVVVARGQFVVGYATKRIAVTSVNAPPSLSGAGGTAHYYEATGRGSPLAPALAVADADDGGMTKATFQIVTANPAVWAPCDPARDALALPGSYMEPASPRVEGSWDATSCTLTLAPSGGAASLPTPEFQAAMRAVVFRSLDARDPSGGATAGAALARQVQVRVTDAASGGLTPATETSPAGTFAYVALHLVDDPPSVSLPAAYAPGGLLYEPDPNANWKVAVVGGVKYRTRKFSLPVDPALSVPTTAYLSLDLRKVGDRAFGGGSAITDPDTLDPLPSGASITLTAVGAPAGVTVAPHLGGSDNAGVPFYIPTDAASPGTALSRIPVTIANPSTQGGGEFRVTLTYGAAAPVSFWVDVRVRGCILARNGGAPVDLTAVYPDQARCADALAADPVLSQTVSAATGATAATADYASLSTAAKAKADALLAAGTRLGDAVAAAAAERSAARGVYAVTVAPGAFSTADGTIALRALPMDASARALVPTPAPGEAVDKDVSLKLGPACQAFAKPVRVCVHVGDTDVSTHTRSLRFASQFDCADASKGYGAMEPATGQSFNPVSGELCGSTAHFSLAVVVVAPVLASATVPKAANMGGSCPNDCSGRGYCRAEGRCVCFQGHTGYDCSQRACPVAQSWDTSSAVAHKQTECANRGLCDRASGRCACYDGYTGAACERAACPNGCSGHGRCLLLGELAGVQAAGYAGWEAARFQVCRCDGGYTGPDCSQRVCPHGDDPETACAAAPRRQVQALTVDFGTIPSSLSGALPASLYDGDEVVLVYTAPDGTNYTTNAVRHVFDPAPAGAASLRDALLSLPNFAVDAVTTSGTGSATSPRVVYRVTFDAPPRGAPTAPRAQVATSRLPGNHALLRCAANADGSMGCGAPGCRPLHKQARLFEFVASGTGVALNPASLFAQPPPLGGGNTAATAGQWGVEVYVAIAPDGFGRFTYEVTSDVYGTGGGASLPRTPLPPGALRKGVPLVYGLTVDFDADAFIVPTAGRGAKFAWRLPTCSVAQEQAADADYESVECGNRGVCDRGSGVCKCHAGYTGYSCSQQTMIM